MKSILFAATAIFITGCASDLVAPNYHARFGDSVREAKLKMTINPDAGKKPDPVVGIDGKSARETVIRYHDSFKAPPPVTNVINIGGAIGSGGGGPQ